MTVSGPRPRPVCLGHCMRNGQPGWPGSLRTTSRKNCRPRSASANKNRNLCSCAHRPNVGLAASSTSLSISCRMAINAWAASRSLPLALDLRAGRPSRQLFITWPALGRGGYTRLLPPCSPRALQLAHSVALGRTAKRSSGIGCLHAVHSGMSHCSAFASAIVALTHVCLISIEPSNICM